ncbi:MAG: hypothetical protein K2P64_06770, partial [Lachnospiraceae bacterium]|nr:hypothetical protein [Lachnospiraceae bacterium]
FTPSIPTFASIDVKAAKTADNSANNNHISFPPLMRPVLWPSVGQNSLSCFFSITQFGNFPHCADELKHFLQLFPHFMPLYSLSYFFILFIKG